MGRNAKYSPEQFIDAALDLVADKGPGQVTISAVAEQLHAPIGSVYHRFPSRDVLLARLWLRTVESFQEGFVDALRRRDGLDAALYTPRWVRSHPKEARLLLLYRREELVSDPWPHEIQGLAARLAHELDTAIIQFTRNLFGRVTKTDIRRTTFALIDVPYAAVRRSLMAAAPPPPEVDEFVAETYAVIMGRMS